MKLRLLQAGYGNFDGLLGVTLFKNGISVNDVPAREARTIGMSIKAEYEGGHDPNPASMLTGALNNKAEQVRNGLDESLNVETQDSLEETIETPEETGSDEDVSDEYTLEGLEDLASLNGIKSVRDIAKEFGVKGVSINDLIKGILKAQASK
jgi:hypothetical protein